MKVFAEAERLVGLGKRGLWSDEDFSTTPPDCKQYKFGISEVDAWVDSGKSAEIE